MKQTTDLASRKHDIPLETALQHIKDFRTKFPANNKEGLAHSEAFNKDAVMKLLNHPNCAGLRIANGLKTNRGSQEIVFILMGIDKDGKNILSTNPSLSVTNKAQGVNIAEEDEDSPTQNNGAKGPPYEDGLN